jgi:hypothetical protein
MTPERIKEAQQRACRHLTLQRVLDIETQEYEDTWWCDDCEQELDLTIFSSQSKEKTNVVHHQG